MIFHFKGRTLAALLLFLLSLLSPAWADSSRPNPSTPSGNPKVLILVGPHYGLPLSESIIPPLMRTLTDGGISLNDIFLEYLDLYRHDDPDYRSTVLALLRHKLTGSRNGLIIAINQKAVDFVIQDGADLLPEAPILVPIMSGQPNLPILSRQVITLTSQPDPQETLRLALALFPDIRRAVLIAGKDDKAAPFLDPLAEAIKALPNQVEVKTTKHLPCHEMLELVANLLKTPLPFSAPTIRTSRAVLSYRPKWRAGWLKRRMFPYSPFAMCISPKA
ncbi:hypothetical protein [Desulfonatronum parangueonense]